MQVNKTLNESQLSQCSATQLDATAPHLRNKLKVLWLCDIVWPEIICWIRISSTDVGKASSGQSIDQGLMHLGLDWTSKVSNRKCGENTKHILVYFCILAPQTQKYTWHYTRLTRLYRWNTKISSFISKNLSCSIPNTYGHYQPLQVKNHIT